jgi:HlyD family secretion protein
MAKSHTSVGLPLGGGQAVAFNTTDDSVSSGAILEFQSPTLTLISAPAPFTARMTLWLIGTLVLLSMVLFGAVPVDRIVATTGVILAQSPNVIVQPFEQAIVKKIFVKEGQMVKKGDVLAELDSTIAKSAQASTIAQSASLKAQVDRLKAELADKTYFSDGSQYSQLEELAYLQRRQQFTTQVAQYDAQMQSLQSKVDTAKHDIDSLTARLVGLKTVEDMRRDLEKFQVGSRLNTLAAMDQRLTVEGQLADARSAMQGATKDMAAQQAQRDAWIHQWYGDTQQLEAQQERALSDMISQATTTTLRTDLTTLRAEVDSIVLNIARVAPGTVLQSGVELMTTVPVDAKLQVSAPIDGADAGFVSVGDKVAIKFDTLPYFRYGYAEGHIEKISNDSFVDPTSGQNSPTTQQPTISTQAPQNLGTAPVYFYHASISIDRLQLKHPPESFRIMPGMPVEADIRVGQRSIMDYMFDRILPFFSQGMREPT